MELVPWGRTDRALYLAPDEARCFRGNWHDESTALLRHARRCVARGLPLPLADELARAARALRAHDSLASRAPVPADDWRDTWAMSRLSWLCVGRRAAEARAVIERIERRFAHDHNVWPF